MGKKSVLVLGGTGAMGKPLVQILDKAGFSVTVTSRSEHSSDTVKYVKGNAHQRDFLKNLLKQRYDVIVDFMSYHTSEFKEISKIILPQTSQYIFISSARVYAKSDKPLTENSPRLLDICEDNAYLATDEYALSKARQENILYESGYSNWTIVRPGLTYNDERLQLAICEKEEWLYRALNGRTIVFPKELETIHTTMTHGNDVALAISKLVDNPGAGGEVLHIAGAKATTWGQIYQNVLLKHKGMKAKVYYAENVEKISIVLDRYYQVKYSRATDRTFNNDKLYSVIGPMNFIPPEVGLPQCLSDFIMKNGKFKRILWKTEACFDRLTKERTPLRAFASKKGKLAYFVARYTGLKLK